MAEIRWRFGHLLSLGVLLGCISSAVAAPTVSTDEELAMAKDLNTELTRSFFLSKELALDPSLRVAANAISAAHLTRIKQLVPVWLQEERRLQTSPTEKPGSNEVLFAVWARLLNELALWQIEPGDPEYEQATLDALKTSHLPCRIEGDERFSDFAARMLRVQAMPAAQQQAALATERALLERWGTPRPAPQPWPDPLPQDVGMLAIAQIRDGGPRPPLALAPHLAAALLAKREGYSEQPWETKCAFQRWWLRVSLAQGTAPGPALLAFRYGTLITATERLGQRFELTEEEASKAEPQKAPMPYPRLAMRFDVTGTTTVTRRAGAAGKPDLISVTDRKIKVRGIRGTRPVAFETTFDELAVQYALKNGVPAKPGKSRPQAFQLVWNLEPPDTKTDKTTQGETP